mmetsp:Transcript_11578/g.19269  ORF Transcript_11578/g.19269 Transcript_11578/m.19269 type:complete len:84 (+) Transcript_11578:354-605(+)
MPRRCAREMFPRASILGKFALQEFATGQAASGYAPGSEPAVRSTHARGKRGYFRRLSRGGDVQAASRDTHGHARWLDPGNGES